MSYRYLVGRLRRAMGAMTVAELARRSQVSRSRIKRILDSRGYVIVDRQTVANLASAVGLTYEYLADGRPAGLFVRARPEGELVMRVSQLEAENGRLRARAQPRLMQSALTRAIEWANQRKLEIKLNGETNKYEIVEESEFVLAEGDNWVEAISNAHANAHIQAEARG